MYCLIISWLAFATVGMYMALFYYFFFSFQNSCCSAQGGLAGLSLALLLSLLTPHTSLVRGIVYRSQAEDHQLTMEEVLTRLAESEKEVSLALVINNMSGHKLSLEEVDLSCGVFSNNSSMPESIPPATTAVVFIEKVAQ